MRTAFTIVFRRRTKLRTIRVPSRAFKLLNNIFTDGNGWSGRTKAATVA